MLTPIQTTLQQPDGNDREVVIEPMIKKDGEQQLRNTGVYKIYNKDGYGDETHLFEDGVAENGVEDLDGNFNSNYLGELRLVGKVWTYIGNFFSPDEQNQLTAAIASSSQH